MSGCNQNMQSVVADSEAGVVSVTIGGDNGPPGVPGPQGPQGPQGIAGPQGDQGMSGVSAINQASDVAFDAPADGDVVRYSSGKWRNYPDTGLVDGGNF